MNDRSFREALERAYHVFARYSYAGIDFCTFCRTEEQIRRLRTTDLRALGEEDVRSILWESSDHWESADVFRHYLPRAIEAMGPPMSIDDMYPRHLPDTLLALGFHKWAAEEKSAILDCLVALRPFLNLSDASAREEWDVALAALGG